MIEEKADRIVECFKDVFHSWADAQSLKEVIMLEFGGLAEEVEQLKAQLAAVERDFNDFSKSTNELL